MKIHKIALGLMLGALTFSGKTAIAGAAEIPIAGINLSLSGVYQHTTNASEEIATILQSTNMFSDLAFARVTSYVNIRSEASEEGEILGKLYNNAAATILSQEGDWYKISSGSVKGYIKSEFLVTGEKAAKLYEELGTRLAVVNTTTLRVREKDSIDSAVLTLVPIGEEMKVIKEAEDFIKVSLDGSTAGYVAAEYVQLQTVFEEAVSIEEERERLEEEAAAGSEGSGVKENVTPAGSSLGSKIASYALRFQGNPYVWGGTSLTRGADCSGFTQSVFANFGIRIPRTSRTQATGGRRVSLSNLQAGDLVFYARKGTINHVAIYIGNGKVISASSPSTGIRVSRYNYRQPVKAVSYLR